MNDPLAPIVHHWQDATHVTFGVLTAGVFTRSLRLEGVDLQRSRAGRDAHRLRLRGSLARLVCRPPHLESVGELEPLGILGVHREPRRGRAGRVDASRLPLSVLSAHTFASGAQLNTAFVFGANQHEFAEHLEPSYLAESSLQLGGIHNLFARAEYVRKDAEELALGPDRSRGRLQRDGADRRLSRRARGPSPVRAGIGARGSVNLLPASLSPIYGSATPTGFAVYVRLAPQRMSSGHDMGARTRGS